MRKILLQIILSIFGLIIGYNTSFSQFSNDIDGSLNVNDLNGSLNYNYPISSNSIDGFPIKVNLTYVDNVLMTSMDQGYIVDEYSHISFGNKTRTNPLWIVGVNQFAIQVLGHRGYFSKFHDPFDILTGHFLQFNYGVYEQQMWLVDGYDFCNQLKEVHSGGEVDKIRLLKTDGSVMELVNSNTSSTENENKYTGTYFESGINTNGFAIVEYDSTYWPQYMKNQVPLDFPKRYAFIPRKLKYYGGDGLEYVFKEVVSPFNFKTYVNRRVPLPDNNYVIVDSHQNGLPRIFYLIEINSSQRSLLKFKREWHNFDDVTDYSIGHAPIKEFQGHKFSWGSGEFLIEALGRTLKFNHIENYLGEMGGDPYNGGLSYLWNQPFESLHSSINDCYITKIKDSCDARINQGLVGGGSLFYITKILDPENRSTKFRYKNFLSKIYNDPNSYYFERNFLRMDSVTEPTKAYRINYKIDSNNFYYDSFDKFQYYPNNSNMVESVTLFNLNNGIFSDSLQKEIYSFTRNIIGSDTCKVAEKTTYNYPNNGNYTRKITNFMKFYEVPILNPSQNIPDSLQKETYPYVFKVIQEDLNIKNTYTKKISQYAYTPIKNLCQTESSNDYYFMLTDLRTLQYVPIDNDTSLVDTIEISKIKLKYKFDTVLALYPHCNKVVPSEIYTTQYLPNNDPQDTILNINKEEFLNLPYQKVYVNRQDTIWNFYESKYATLYAQSHGDFATVNDYVITTRQDTIIVPPVYGLQKGTHLLKSDSSYIGGSISLYQTTFEDDLSHPRRGAILSKYSIGLGGIDTVKVADYDYKAGNYRNLMNTSYDAFGSQKKIFYDYKDVGSNWEYPTGKVMTDLDNITSQTLFKQFEEYETPLVTDDYVRKYSPLKNGYYTDTLRTYNERTYFGQVGAYIDPNGWIYRKKYDYNGRELYQWHPYDFPENVSEIMQTACERIYDVKTKKSINKYYLYVEKADSTQGYTEQIIETYSSADTLTKWDSRVGKVISDNVVSEDSVYYKHLIIEEDYKTVIKYTAGQYDKIHNTSTNSAILNLSFLQMIDKGDMTIRIKCDTLNFDKWFLLSNDTQDSSNVFVTEETGGIRVNLADVLSQLKGFNNDESCEFEVSLESDEGLLSLQTNADDNGISICTDLPENNYLDDFTFKYVYDDNSRMKRSIAKIDDPLHTNNIPSIQNFGCNGRYTESQSYFMADNFNNRTHFLIGNPQSPSRTDSISFTRTLFTKYNDSPSTPNTHLYIKATDQFGNSNYTYSDNEGNSIIINNDYSSNNSNSLKRKFSVLGGFIDSEIYGEYFKGNLIKKVTTYNEDQKPLVQYFDLFDNLRISVIDTNGTELITKYSYNEIGQLIKLTNSNGDSTKYYYDSFGNLKYKYNPINGYSSFRYDNLGRLRFSQNQEQSLNRKMSFTQYDDLGRVTIIGEAKFNINQLNYEPNEDTEGNMVFNRLTDRISPNYIHNYPADTTKVYVNSTLFHTYFDMTPIPSFTKVLNLTRPLDKYDSAYIPVPPFILNNSINYPYEPIIDSSSALDFENIAAHPENVLVSNLYDNITDYPIDNYEGGSIWGHCPNPDNFKNISMTYTLNNLKGRKSAMAYRDNSKEDFNYVFFSYDARGRIEAVLRYTDKLGYDAVYYKYNSMNKVIKLIIADRLRQFVTWYDYDDNGRVSKVYTYLDTVGSGLGETNLHPPFSRAKGAIPDLAYDYDKRNAVSKIAFLPDGMLNPHYQEFFYSSRGWLDSMIAKSYTNVIVFKEKLNRNVSGRISSQISKQLNQTERTESYTYDYLNRLTNWTDNTNSGSYSYDRLGNRLTSQENTLNNSYAYSSGNSNILDSVFSSNNSKVFSYNSIGAVTTIVKEFRGNPISQQEFDYAPSGVMKYFKYSEEGQTAECEATTATAYWQWEYRMSPFGGREHKRMLSSPEGDSCSSSMTWLYYLRGAGGEELAMYHGLQYAADTANPGRNVIFYPVGYNVDGGLVVVKPDGTKEFNVRDHIGNVRATYTFNRGFMDYRNYDYKPFGDTLSTYGGREDGWKGFNGESKDLESSYMNMGARIYDPSIGRFLSVDPLFEVFPNQSPYSYSFNNPLSFKDPSGMAPEKENSGKMRIQGEKTTDQILNEAMYQENCERMTNEFSQLCNELTLSLYKASDDADKMVSWLFIKNLFSGGGGGSDGGGGKGKTESNNGTKDGWEDGKRGTKYIKTLKEGETPESLSKEKWAEILSVSNDYLNEKSYNANREWGATISYDEENNQIVVSNFHEGGIDEYGNHFVEFETDGISSDFLILGSLHTHPNTGDAEISGGDYGMVYKTFLNNGCELSNISTGFSIHMVSNWLNGNSAIMTVDNTSILMNTINANKKEYLNYDKSKNYGFNSKSAPYGSSIQQFPIKRR